MLTLNILLLSINIKLFHYRITKNKIKQIENMIRKLKFLSTFDQRNSSYSFIYTLNAILIIVWDLKENKFVKLKNFSILSGEREEKKTMKKNCWQHDCVIIGWSNIIKSIMTINKNSATKTKN